MVEQEWAAGRSALVAFGSQTGNAEDCAEVVRRVCERQRCRTRCLPMDAIDSAVLSQSDYVIFVCSTTGQGDMPDNMKKFWKFALRKDLPPIFDGTRFAVFGLGDSTYPKYNWASRKLEKRILQLGGLSFLARGEGDEQHEQGIEGTLSVWIDMLVQSLDTLSPLPPHLQPLQQSELLPPSFHVCLATSATQTRSRPGALEGLPGRVSSNQRLTHPRHWQDVRLVEFDLEAAEFEPGDVAVLHPENSDADVDTFLNAMQWSAIAQEELAIEPCTDTLPKTDLPDPPTLYSLAKKYFDLRCVPKRTIFEYLFHFSSDEMHRERLAEFCSAEGVDDYFDYVTRPRRTLLEVFEEFDSVQIPLNYIFDALPKIKGRQFSIANSLRKHPKQIHICAALVKYQTILKRPREGVCSRWLRNLQIGDTTTITINRGTMVQPGDVHTPLVLIGPGTGVAPMRALLQDRICLGSRSNTLFFGNRNIKYDFLFNCEMLEYANQGFLDLYLAFSRDSEQKYYVQDAIKANSEKVFRVLHEHQGTLCISGSSGKMPSAVRGAIVEVITQVGSYEPAEAEKYLLHMEKQGRYLQETW